MVDGPVALGDEPVVVSLTEFTGRYVRDLAGIARAGLALTRGWWALEGAIGVTLYYDAFTMTGGSVSVWRSEADLRRFVALPRHAAIMRRYRNRGTVRAATWMTEGFRIDEALAQRAARLAG
jgi:heme-degrading monooxygenase HmoA